MNGLAPIFEQEIKLRSEGYSFPHSLWTACKEFAKEPDGGPETTRQYRATLQAIADASGKHEIGVEHVEAALKAARGEKHA